MKDLKPEGRIRVVARTELQRRHDVEAHARADEREFRSHEVLRHFLPAAGHVDFAWLHADAGGSIAPRQRETDTLLLVLDGDANLIGDDDRRRRVGDGDAITIPLRRAYGFADAGARGIDVLEIALGERSDPVPAQGRAGTLEGLLRYNDERTRAIVDNPLFVALRDGTLDDEASRKRMLDAIQVFSDAFQTILLTRQATCRTAPFESVFGEHFEEELGHNELLATGRAGSKAADPILAAASAWFCRRMLVLDNLEKAVLVHLVLEAAGHEFHSRAKAVFSDGSAAQYFDAHSAADDGHRDLVLPLLEAHDAATYYRLERVLEQGWDMFDLVGRRIARLTRGGTEERAR